MKMVDKKMEKYELNESQGVQISAVCNHRGYTYAVTHYTGLILLVDLQNGYAEVLGEINQRKEFATPSYKIIPYKDSLIIIPFDHDSVVFFNLLTHEISMIELPASIKDITHKFIDAFLNGDDLYLFGYAIDKILVLDMTTYCFRDLQIKDSCFNGEEALWARCGVKIGCNYFVPLMKQSGMLCLNMLNDEVSYISIKGCKKGFSAIIQQDNYLWMIPSKGSLFHRYNTDDGEIVELSYGKHDTIYPYQGGVNYGNSIYVIPADSNNAPLRIDIRSLTVSVLESYEKVVLSSWGGSGISQPFLIQDEIGICLEPDRMVMYSVKDDTIREINVHVKEFPSGAIQGHMINEKMFSLKNFLQTI